MKLGFLARIRTPTTSSTPVFIQCFMIHLIKLENERIKSGGNLPRASWEDSEDKEVEFLR
ncbi:hypothetical protein BCR26_01985 [Enterococcus rivorum]|uniref:Uncharacterized protein n=1 Tax=Enterococcus rivorum TaxID=762845 RepID=A0A1E5KZ32_9ENTE|nr:hypothetical protein BCR26_01985 [Enterococcus rivorum]